MPETHSQDKLVQLMDDMPIAMMTTFGSAGPRSIPRTASPPSSPNSALGNDLHGLRGRITKDYRTA